MNNPEKPLQLERIENIKNILRENKSVKVGNLSTFFDVSENTIRRDLMELENEGFCIRSKGGATLAGKPDSAHSFSIRMDKNYELKREIAEKASSLLKPGSTVILDSGTTGLEFARIIKTKKHITVITPSLDAALILADIPGITLIMPGGVVYGSSRSLTGQPAEDFFSSIHADILFLAVKAVSIEEGLSDHTISEASVKRRMINSADRICILADNSKLGRTSLCKICPIDRVDYLATDHKADKLFLNKIREKKITLL